MSDEARSPSPEPASQSTPSEPYINDPVRNDTEDVAGKIFIGGLSWQTTELNLRYYFEKFGELTDVALMMDKRTGKPRGFGFIKMKDPAAADVVMANEHTIDGRLVDVKRALPRDKAPGPARSEACKIFVGGLSSEVTEKEFGDYFSKYGVVKDAVVMVDRNTGSSRGFGFITFEKEDVVEKVLSIEHEIKGKYVEIKRAEPREATRPPGGGYDSGSYGGGGMGSSRGGGRGGGGRYPGPGGGGRGGMNDSYGGSAGVVGGGYGMAPAAAGYMGGRGGNMGYGRYPGGYGGVPYRSGAPYAMASIGPGYGYATPQPMGGHPAMGYYGGAMPANGGYAGYGAAASGAPGGGPASGGYGGATYAGAQNQGRPGPEAGYGVAATQGDYQSAQQHHGVMQGGDGGAGKSYDSSAIAGYASAAMQMRAQQPYGAYGGAAPVAGYGGSYGYQGAMMQNPNARGPGGQDGAAGGGVGGGGYGPEGGYGAYRGQGAAQGRADRSYRPY